MKLFLAPFASAVLLQNYQQINSRIITCTESILTQLVLQHALRIRMVVDTNADSKASPSGTTTPVTSESTVATDGPASVSTSDTNGHQSQDVEAGSDSGTTAQDSEASTLVPTPSTTTSATSKSLVGRMNNLISSDLQALGRSTDVLQILVAVPLGIIGSTVFLYNILGWR